MKAEHNGKKRCLNHIAAEVTRIFWPVWLSEPLWHAQKLCNSWDVYFNSFSSGNVAHLYPTGGSADDKLLNFPRSGRLVVDALIKNTVAPFSFSVAALEQYCQRPSEDQYWSVAKASFSEWRRPSKAFQRTLFSFVTSASTGSLAQIIASKESFPLFAARARTLEWMSGAMSIGEQKVHERTLEQLLVGSSRNEPTTLQESAKNSLGHTIHTQLFIILWWTRLSCSTLFMWSFWAQWKLHILFKIISQILIFNSNHFGCIIS